MAANQGTRGGLGTTKLILDILIGIVVLIGAAFIVLPFVKPVALGDILAKPTIVPTVRAAAPSDNTSFNATPNTSSVAPPIPGVAQNAATAQALFDAAVLAGEQAAPVQNVGQGDVPAVLVSKPAEERQSAGDNVPTAEPAGENSGIFGSKPALVNPQEDHTCKHGQVWTERGCKNP